MHRINSTKRTKTIGLALEPGLYDFVYEYAYNLGTSKASAVRRLILLGAWCESEHGNAVMPASYEGILRFRDEQRRGTYLRLRSELDEIALNTIPEVITAEELSELESMLDALPDD